MHRAIVWQDRRTAARCEALKKEGLAPAIAAKTGLVIDPYFSATKLAGSSGHPRLRARRRGRSPSARSTPGRVEAHRRRHLTDPSNASRTMLYDIHRGE